MADVRRIIWSNYVLPQATTTTSAVEGTLEEVDLDIPAYSTKYIIDSTVGKRLGGGGEVSLTYEQTTQEWTSFAHPRKHWEDYNDDQADGGNNAGLDDWDSGNAIAGQQGAHYWSNYLTVGTTGITLSSQTADLKFLYIKNVGSTYAVKLAMDGNDYDIKIAPGAAVCIRGGHANCNCNTPKVKSDGGESNDIEFIIAK